MAYKHPSLDQDVSDLKSLPSGGSVMLEERSKGMMTHPNTETQADTTTDGALHKRMDGILDDAAVSAETIRYI